MQRVASFARAAGLSEAEMHSAVGMEWAIADQIFTAAEACGKSTIALAALCEGLGLSMYARGAMELLQLENSKHRGYCTGDIHPSIGE